jgi:hypothetical protein
MIDVPVGKTITLITVESDDTCDECGLRCYKMACGRADRVDRKNVIFRVIDLPPPVDVTPLLDALKTCNWVFSGTEGDATFKAEERDYYADITRQIVVDVLEQWKADHAGD